ncbi:MAG: hypothetical protein QME58_13890 [Bacteroidota bacterium]|nr:hypothetical protein [Bacteroidota bacterium]
MEPKKNETDKLKSNNAKSFYFDFEIIVDNKQEIKTIEVQANTINSALETALKKLTDGGNAASWKLIKTY